MAPRGGLFCKSFRRDLDRFGRLYESVVAFVEPSLPFVASVPQEDLALFQNRFGSTRVEFVTDQALVGTAADRQSWKLQQIVKLHAFRLDFADAWLMVDSDFYFIRPYTARDLFDESDRVRFPASWHRHVYSADNAAVRAYIAGDALPLVDAATLDAERAPASSFSRLTYFQRQPWPWRNKDPYAHLAQIPAAFGRRGPIIYYMPGPVWTTRLCQTFEEEFLAPRRLTYRKLVAYSPWEAVWLGEWGFARGGLDLLPVEQAFLHFATDSDIEHARSAGLTEASLADRYAGIALAAGQQSIMRF